MRYIAPLLADFANGIFATLITGYVTGVEVEWWHFLIGIVIAMSPDVDAIPEAIRRRGHLAASAEDPDDHREYLHYPVLFFLVGLVLSYFSPFWGIFFLVGTALHFLNDLYGTGWGISLLWPLTKDRFKLFCGENNEFSFKLSHFVRRIPSQQLKNEIITYGNENWVEEYYLHITTISAIEYTLFVVSVVLMIIHLV